MFYKLGVLLISLVVFFLLRTEAFASENFRTDYSITYTLTESVKTHAKMGITLTNRSTQYYASSYKIQLGFSDVSNLKVFDEDELIVPNVSENEEGTWIEIDFVNKVVGLASRHNFSIEFDTDEIAENSGNIWEVNIPGLDEDSSADSFNVSLVFPKDLGAPAYIKPQIQNIRQNGNTLFFSKEDLGNKGLSIAFGSYQVYDFDLSYHLENANVVPQIYSVSLPPQTAYQEIKIDDIFPKPANVIRDYDGNYIASFLLKPGSRTDVSVKGQAKILLHPKKTQITKEEIEIYTQEKKYWQSDDSEIKKLALELGTAENIYKYVSENLTYDFSRVKENQERLGAKTVLGDPTSAVCLEFTDLFIALARAAGIPAREVVGFAYTQNARERPLSLIKDVLHAWPEYYDSEINSWVMVDPTWGSTTNGMDYFHTLDFDHFAFAIHGTDSERPIPAGGYKTKSSGSGRDVDVKPSRTFGKSEAILDISPGFSSSYVAGFPISSSIKVRNTGNTVSQNSFILASSKTLTPDILNLKVNQIPPFGELTIPVSFEKKSFLTNENVFIKIQSGSRELNHSFYIRPFFYQSSFYLGGAGLVALLTITIFIYLRRSRRLSIKEPQG